MKSYREARIRRAKELIPVYPQSADILRFYIDLATFQSGMENPPIEYFSQLLDLVEQKGTKLLAEYGTDNLRTPESQFELLDVCWNNPHAEDMDPAARFYARVLLQPWAEQIAARTEIPATDPMSSVCPVCNAKPVAGVLRGEGDGAKRHLLCSLCSTEWPYRRVLCPKCGDENKDHLPIYTGPEIPHVRVEACDTCHTYIKSIDLTRDGRAVPLVDELATLSLNIWAEEHGYVKLEPNLFGM